MKKPPVPITKPTLEAYDAYAPLFRSVIESGRLTMGKQGEALEKKVAAYLGVKHCIAVSSCTSGLMLVLKGLGLSGEVIVPSFTFSASGHALVWNGLTPVFADIDPDTFTVDPASVEKLITPRTSAILAVHPFGAVANARALEELAKKHGLKLVFDAAHAFGAQADGARVGSFGDAEVFSMSPIKILTAGEGGLITTNNDELAAFCRLGRNYGDDGTNDTLFIGLSARLSELHAAVALRSFATLRTNLAMRRTAAAYLAKGFAKREPGIRFQTLRAGTTSTYYVLCAYIDEAKLGYTRDQLHDFLKQQGIHTRKYFHPVLHQQTAYKKWKPKAGTLPVTEQVASRVLSLPLYSHISKDDMNRALASFDAFKATL